MMDREQIQQDLAVLSARLRSRRGPLLERWRASAKADPLLTTGPALTRRQFVDHIPALLDAFEAQLKSWDKPREAAADVEEERRAAEHGLQRWRQGYQLVEVMREWRHLNLCLVEEIESQAEGLSAQAMVVARVLLAQLCGDGVSESADRYFQMQRAEAHSRLGELEIALRRYEDLERRRADLWREAAHDLRGNLGVVKTATAVLTREDLAEQPRARSLGILHRGVESMHALLNDLINLARLEAGREVRHIQEFDVAEVLGELCRTSAQLAETRGLTLGCEGPRELWVRGDAMKVRRVAQNLLLNALTYTQDGAVRVSYANAGEGRWNLLVSDTGPGIVVSAHLASDPQAPIEPASLSGVDAQGNTLTGQAAIRAALGAEPVGSRSGEGIGLSIVKRLCELLDGTLELHSAPGEGTIFMVSFPSDYES